MDMLLRPTVQLPAKEVWKNEPFEGDLAYLIWGNVGNEGCEQRGHGSPSWPLKGPVGPTFGLVDGVGDWALIAPEADRWTVVVVDRSEIEIDPHTGLGAAPRGWVVFSGSPALAMSVIAPKLSVALSRGRTFPADIVRVGEGAAVTHGVSMIGEFDGDFAALGEDSFARSTGSQRIALVRGGWAEATGFASLAAAYDGSAKSSGEWSASVAVSPPLSVSSEEIFERGYAVEAAEFGVAAALAHGSVAKAGEGGAIVLIEHEIVGGAAQIGSIFASKVGENGIKAETWYLLRQGRPIEVESSAIVRKRN